ncbi:hypothetical protein D5S17_19355 [Pseudonocardiaceae bacterium YIM PH 21723]|nr:hypothetical protein D5S17_19355 [Pseudonocardiaceae bacterium YIM PH 21723]
MDKALQDAVLERLAMLDKLAEQGDDETLVPLARTEMQRLADGWRKLLKVHQATADGRCQACPGMMRNKRWPCQVWLMAQRHLIGDGQGKRNRRNPLFRFGRKVSPNQGLDALWEAESAEDTGIISAEPLAIDPPKPQRALPPAIAEPVLNEQTISKDMVLVKLDRTDPPSQPRVPALAQQEPDPIPKPARHRVEAKLTADGLLSRPEQEVVPHPTEITSPVAAVDDRPTIVMPPVGGHLSTDSQQIHRARIQERTSPLFDAAEQQQ